MHLCLNMKFIYEMLPRSVDLVILFPEMMTKTTNKIVYHLHEIIFIIYLIVIEFGQIELRTWTCVEFEINREEYINKMIKFA